MARSSTPEVNGRSTTPTVRFEGEPGNVQALVHLPPADRLSVSVACDLPKGLGEQVRTLTAPVGADWTTVRLLLPPATPAGEYQAELTWRDGTLPGVVVVRGDERVQAVPADLALRARAGEAVPASVVLHNGGNVGVEVRKVYVVALEESEALDRAIIAGLTTDKQAVDRFGVAADALAGSQAGVARTVVTRGAGALAPGETRQVDLELRMPEGLEAGTSYSGTWTVGRLDVPVEVEVSPPAEESRPRRTPRKRPTKEQQ